MRMYIKLWLVSLGFICWGVQSTFAQASIEASAEKVYTRSFTIGIISSNRGYGIQANYLRGEGDRQLYMGLDTRLVRSLFESKVNPIFPNDLRYVFGKLNYFFVSRPEIGFSYKFIPRSHLNLLDVHAGFAVGPSIGVTSPYYIQICDGLANQSCAAVPFDPDIHTFQTIGGRASFFGGGFSPRFYAGLGGKLFATLDLAGNESFISAIRFETTADLFLQKVPIMMESENLSNQRIFLSFSASFVMGGKW